MRSASFRKFNQYIFFPDLANKFLFVSMKSIPSVEPSKIYLMYIFRQKSVHNYIALKSLIMLNSLHSKICLTSSRIIIVKYAKTQSHSVVYIPLTFTEFINTMLLYSKRPVPITTALKSFINESKHFVFPGFVKYLRLPSWRRNVNISLQSNKKNYWLFFFKTAFID